MPTFRYNHSAVTHFNALIRFLGPFALALDHYKSQEWKYDGQTDYQYQQRDTNTVFIRWKIAVQWMVFIDKRLPTRKVNLCRVIAWYESLSESYHYQRPGGIIYKNWHSNRERCSSNSLVFTVCLWLCCISKPSMCRLVFDFLAYHGRVVCETGDLWRVFCQHRLNCWYVIGCCFFSRSTSFLSFLSVLYIWPEQQKYSPQPPL